MALAPVNYQPADIEAERRRNQQAALSAYQTGQTAGVAGIAARSPFSYGRPGYVLPQASLAPSVAQAAKANTETAGMWNTYSAGQPQAVKDWVDAIAKAGAEGRWYYNVRLGEEAAKNRAAAAARARAGRGGGGGGRRRGGGGGGGGGGGSYGYGSYAPSGPSFGDYVSLWLATHGGQGGAPPAYTPAAPQPYAPSYTIRSREVYPRPVVTSYTLRSRGLD